MSERGTWITEFIYCDKCIEKFREFLNETECAEDGGESKYWSFGRVGQHAFAGRISGLFSGEELQLFEFHLIPKLKEMLCHPLRIAVLADHGEMVFTVLPPIKDFPRESISNPMTREQLAAREPFAAALVARLDGDET
jgi:hypothetical protein